VVQVTTQAPVMDSTQGVGGPRGGGNPTITTNTAPPRARTLPVPMLGAARHAQPPTQENDVDPL
jgi:hypothetical protein